MSLLPGSVYHLAAGSFFCQRSDRNVAYGYFLADGIPAVISLDTFKVFLPA